jgi:hypothetical protein
MGCQRRQPSKLGIGSDMGYKGTVDIYISSRIPNEERRKEAEETIGLVCTLDGNHIFY